MFSRFRVALGLALISALVPAIPVFAGGWAVIVLDELPTSVVAGEPLTIGFTVLQHGRTPMEGLDPIVTAKLSLGEKFVVKAEPGKKPGHYVATLIFPKEGNWNWSIQAFSMDQPMPTLSVAAPADGVASQPVVKSEPAAEFPWLVVGASALGVGLAALAFAFRRRSRLVGALAIFCLAVGVGLFAAESAVPEVEAQVRSLPEMSGGSSLSQVELGGRLFVAKGCITCHANNKVSDASAYWSVEAGPNLTKFSASPEALRLRLKDPASVNSNTQMPNLNLSAAEIEALIAFINSK